MGKRNRNLLVILITLLMVNVVFALIGTGGNDVSFNERRFVLSDTSSVTRVTIGEKVELEKGSGKWMLNEAYEVDQSLQRLLFSIMQRVRVKKPAEVKPADAVEVRMNGDKPMTFSVWGNPTKTKTYFSLAGDDDTYEVHIPGYNEYLGGIFELAPDQWRDRLLVDASWRTIQDLSLKYYRDDQDDWNIAFDKDFFIIKDVAPIDSNAVVEYLNQFQYFQVNEWLSEGRFPRYDSLTRKQPLATLSMETINLAGPFTMDIYPKLPGERFYISKTDEESLFVIDEKRMENILRSKQDFSMKE